MIQNKTILAKQSPIGLFSDSFVDFEEKSMNIFRAVEKACKEPTLLDALSWICVWESERIVKQAKKGLRDVEGKGWDTYFRVCIKEVLDKYFNDYLTDPDAWFIKKKLDPPIDWEKVALFNPKILT